MHKCAAQVVQERPDQGIGDASYQLSVAMGAMRLTLRGDAHGLARLLRRSPPPCLELEATSVHCARLEVQLPQELGAAEAAGRIPEGRRRADSGSRLMAVMRAWRRRRAPAKIGSLTAADGTVHTQTRRATRVPCRVIGRESFPGRALRAERHPSFVAKFRS